VSVLADVVALVLTWMAYVTALAGAVYVVSWPVLRAVGRRRASPGHARGWRPWALWALAAACLVAAAPALTANVERRARIAKARGDVFLIGKAVAAYAAHCGGPPPADATAGDCRVATSAARAPLPKALLKPQRNARGLVAGPFLTSIRRLPPGWSGVEGVYAYVTGADGARVCAAGDGVVADSLGAGRCPEPR
jgi:hypothetical protein